MAFDRRREIINGKLILYTYLDQSYIYNPTANEEQFHRLSKGAGEVILKREKIYVKTRYQNNSMANWHYEFIN